MTDIRLHIAILVCDTPIQPVLQNYGDYFTMFQDLLRQGFEDLDLTEKKSGRIVVEFSEHNAVDREFPDLTEVDALLLTGSKHDAWADDQWIRDLTNKVRETVVTYKKPVVGVCFGHQILARALGARVGRNELGWEVSVEKLTLTEAGKELFGKDTLSIQQMHRDIVFDTPPDGCVNLAESPRCGIQGLYLPKRLLSVQGHPEYNEGIMSCLLKARHEIGIFSDELYNDGSSRVGDSHDGRLIARVMARFILDAKN
ncbi:uncharacterized protein N7515_006766 [Penicillium bovifimosum]|uniref:Glutamine amidotransferase domain-containing protein n=1 Tax=Penicillium bovifimosum TaxID=126998 RepID=A0A9W9L1J4_9EURO|nr:uncharacterized protein N7515_006766 [Penicillium bovifimosum]KAJ5130727.1 hypothetical protein N7515_006766 [Penicillium bovifimosum]